MRMETHIRPKAKRGAGLIISYDFQDHHGLKLLVGRTPGGAICFAGFTDDAKIIQRYYPKAVLQETGAAQNPALESDFYVEGTALQIAVWQTLLKLPAGQTITYKELAQRLGRPQSVRAVANAVAANPVSLFVPCHRIVHTNPGRMGYAWGAEIKQQLLTQERR